MANNINPIDVHVAELLSGYLDKELTQQQRQRVEIHCEACAKCNKELEDLQILRDSIGKARLSENGEDVWREKLDDVAVRTSHSIGWLLVLVGLLIAMGVGIYHFIVDSSLTLVERLIVGGIYGGLALIFLSVLRQRLIERKTDKYQDVEI